MVKRILHVVYSLEIGGLERVVVHLANNMDRSRYQSSVCCISRAGELARYLQDSDRLSVLGHIGRIGYRPLKALHNLLRARSIDIVHSHNFPGLLYSYLPAKLNRTPVIHTQHGYVESEERRKFALVEKVISRSIARYVCVSDRLCDTLKERLDLNDSRLSLVYNGIPLPNLPAGPIGRRDGRIVIGSVGRLTWIKNYELLIKVFSELVKRHPECTLELVGDGERGDALKRLVRSLDLGDRVVMHGYRTNASEYLQRFDIFVLPSLSEGHSISLLEALGMKKVCVVSAVGGNVEIIKDSVNGFLFESDSLDGLLQQLSFAVENIHESTMDALRDRARKTVESRFSLDAMLNNYGELYDIIAAGKHARQSRCRGPSCAG